MTSLIVARQALGYLILFYFLLYCLLRGSEMIYTKKQSDTMKSVVPILYQVRTIVCRIGFWMCAIFIGLHVVVTILQIQELL